MATLSGVLPTPQKDVLDTQGSCIRPWRRGLRAGKLAREISEISKAPWRRKKRCQSGAEEAWTAWRDSPTPSQLSAHRKSPFEQALTMAHQLPSPALFSDPSTTKAPGAWPRARTPLVLTPLKSGHFNASKQFDEIMMLTLNPPPVSDALQPMERMQYSREKAAVPRVSPAPVLSLAPVSHEDARSRLAELSTAAARPALPSANDPSLLTWVQLEASPSQMPRVSPPSLSPSPAPKASDTPSTAYDSEEAREAAGGAATGSTAKVKPVRVACLISEAMDKLSTLHAVWNPDLWKLAHQEIMRTGRLKQLHALMQCVRISSENALRRRQYHISSRKRPVNLGLQLEVVVKAQWFGRDNVSTDTLGGESPAQSDMVTPPLLMCERSALEAAKEVRGIVGPSWPIYVVLEAAEFDDAGGIDLARPTCIHPTCLPLRSDFGRFADHARMQLRTYQATMKEHLCAQRDPYVVLCPDVTIFRGTREEGYPFLEEPMKLNVVVAAMSSTRPDVQVVNSNGDRSEWYMSEGDHTALLERLNLMGLVALQDQKHHIEKDDLPGVVVSQKPILVLSAPGLSGQAKHPKDAVANSLKQWRRRFSQFFHAVYVCTGRSSDCRDPDLCRHLDDTVNRQFYRVCTSELLHSKTMEWHWDRELLGLAYNTTQLRKIWVILRRLQGKRLDKEDFVASASVVSMDWLDENHYGKSVSHAARHDGEQCKSIVDQVNSSMQATSMRDELDVGVGEGASDKDASGLNADEDCDVFESDDEGPPPTQLVAFLLKNLEEPKQKPPDSQMQRLTLLASNAPNLGRELNQRRTSSEGQKLSKEKRRSADKVKVKSTIDVETSIGSKKEPDMTFLVEDAMSPGRDGLDELDTATTTAMTSIMSSSSVTEDSSQFKSDVGDAHGKDGADLQTGDSEPASPQAESRDCNIADADLERQMSGESALTQSAGESEVCKGADREILCQTSGANAELATGQLGQPAPTGHRKSLLDIDQSTRPRRHCALARRLSGVGVGRRASFNVGGERRASFQDKDPVMQQYLNKRRRSLENARTVANPFQSGLGDGGGLQVWDHQRPQITGGAKPSEVRRKSWCGPDAVRTDQELAVRQAARESLRVRNKSVETCPQCGELVTKDFKNCRRCGAPNKNYFQAGQEPESESSLPSPLEPKTLRSSLRGQRFSEDVGDSGGRKPSVLFHSGDGEDTVPGEEDPLSSEVTHKEYPKEHFVAKGQKIDGSSDRRDLVKKKFSGMTQVASSFDGSMPGDQGSRRATRVGGSLLDQSRHDSISVSTPANKSRVGSRQASIVTQHLTGLEEVKDLENMASSIEDRLEKLRRASSQSEAPFITDDPGEASQQHHQSHHHQKRQHGSHQLVSNASETHTAAQRRKWGTHHGAHGHRSTLQGVREDEQEGLSTSDTLPQQTTPSGSSINKLHDSFVYASNTAATGGADDFGDDEEGSFRGMPRARQMSKTQQLHSGRRTSNFSALGSRNFCF